MMRGPHHFAVACRRASGAVALTCEAVPKVLRPNWQKVPFLRGAFALVDAMALGTKALFWAARVAEQDAVSPKQQEEIKTAEAELGPALGTASTGPAPEKRTSRVTDVAIGSAMVTGLIFALFLTVILPNLAVEAGRAIGVAGKGWLSLIDGAVRITLFFAYIVLISRMHYIRRVFQYHGAEHKAINALEAGHPLTVAAAQAQSRLHPRCGTSFVVIVMVISTLAFSPFRELPFYVRILLDLTLTPVVAGVSFEFLRLAGRYRNNPIAAALSRPGMWTQLLTTREPDDDQVEVALASLQAVIDAEREDDAPTDPSERAATSVA